MHRCGGAVRYRPLISDRSADVNAFRYSFDGLRAQSHDARRIVTRSGSACKPVHGELLNWAKITMPHATVPATSDRPTANAGLAGLFGAERFEKELLVERRLGVRAAMKRQEKKKK